MKQYKKYMDNIQVSGTLHQRLLNLEAPVKRSAAWKKYGAAAAALALAVGIGGWGLGGWDAVANRFQPASHPEGEHEGPGQPDIAVEGPGESLEPGMKTIGGYEVRQGGIACYYMLPYIEFGTAEEASGAQLADWDVPPGSVRRELTRADFAALFGREETLSTHLDWGGYELTGWAAWQADGSFWGAFLNGYKGEQDHFELAFTAGDVLPPTCFGHPGGVVNQIWDVPVTAYGYDGEESCRRTVEFLHDGYGFRFDLTATDADQAGDLMSRLTRWLIVEGIAAENITQHGAVPAHPWEAGPGGKDSVDDYDGGCPYCADGTAHTHPYDPGKPAEAVPPKGPDDPGAGNLPDGDPAAYEPQAELP